jgi:hypothetical protein
MKDKLKVLVMLISLPIAIPVAIVIGALFYKQKGE